MRSPRPAIQLRCLIDRLEIVVVECDDHVEVLALSGDLIAAFSAEKPSPLITRQRTRAPTDSWPWHS